MWREGVALPLLPTLYGLFVLVTGHVRLSGRGRGLTLDGGDARAFGLAAITLGAAIHFHYFWGPHPTLSRHQPAALAAATAAFLGAITYIIL